MVILCLRGGLGNQMFQYAFGLSLSTKNNDALFIYSDDLQGEITSRSLELDIFDMELKQISPIQKFFYIEDNRGTYTSRIRNALFRNIFSVKSLREQNRHFQPEFLEYTGNIVVNGSFQSEKYFFKIRSRVRETFKFKDDIRSQASSFLPKIKSNSVALHIRRGDYQNNPFFKKMLGHIGVDYYGNALQAIEDKIEPTRFLIFSDDIDWAEKNIGEGLLKDRDWELMKTTNLSNPAHVDLYLMTLCDHFIISNSSFAWWGAWLSQNENKIVVAPKDWMTKEFQTKQEAYPSDIVPENWIRV